MAGNQGKRWVWRVAVPLAAGLWLAGCAYSMGDFGRRPAVAAAVAKAPDGPAMNLQPAVQDAAATAAPGPATPLPPAAADTSAGPSQAAGFPNINVVPDQPTSKLLTPEEKAKVIAELEALAARQGTPASKGKAASGAECAADAAQPLTPEERLKREREGLKC